MTHIQSFLDQNGSFYAEDEIDLSTSSASTDFQPESYLLSELGKDIRLIEPITLNIEYEEDGDVIALSEDLDIWSDGADFESAIENTKTAIRGLYLSLTSDKDKLGPLPQKHLEFLQTKIDE